MNIAVSGLTSVLAAAVLWGATGTAQAPAPPRAGSTAVGALRLTVGGIALLMLALGLRELPDRHRWPRRTTVAAGLAVATYQLCFFAAVARTCPVEFGTLRSLTTAGDPATLEPWLRRSISAGSTS